MSAYEDYAMELGGPDEIPQAKPGLDWGSLKLSAQEGFVLSRVDGTASLRDIVSMCGLGDAPTLEILWKLKTDGLIVVKGERPGGAPRRGSTALEQRRNRVAKDQDNATLEEMRAWATFNFDAEALNAKAELSDVRRKRILHTYQRLEQMDYYEMLGLEVTASTSAIRKSYYRLTKSYHPDRYFRRDIGVYREFLGAIFKAMGRAYDVLSNAGSRRKYDTMLQHSGQGANRDALVEARERRERAERIYEVGMSKFNAKVYEPALEDFRQALELDPDNAKLVETIRRSEKTAKRAIGIASFRAGQAATAAGDHVSATSEFVKAAEHHPSQAHLRKAVEALLAADRDLDSALNFAKLAVNMEEDSLDNLLTLAKVYEGLGQISEAKEALDRASAVAPGDPEVLARRHALLEGE